MPQTEVYFYQEDADDVPVLDWLRELNRRGERRAVNKCQALFGRLAKAGHELRRPEAAPLRDGIYELRAKVGRVNYRVLYFFHGRGIALLTHGLTKEKAVPDADIDRAVERKRRYEADPDTHRYEPPEEQDTNDQEQP